MGESGYQVSGNAAENYERVASAFMMPWAQHLVGQSRLTGSEHVLDMACGTGFVARAAAGIVGADRVVGVDVNPIMLAVAETAAGIEVRERSADDTGLDDRCVDVVLCQQGLQYFPSPEAALGEARRCLRACGRALFSVWAPFAENPFIAGQIDALEEHLSPEAVAGFRSTNIDALGGEPGVSTLLHEAGLVDVEVTKHRLDIDLPAMGEFFPELISATPWAATFAGLSDSEQRAVIARMDDAVSQRADQDGTTATMTVIVAEGSAG
ncbi:class I SAM-dependent methyltransferase [Ilumatobacter sp.]|uniref:class I SAM-dependent methyltransferase n=1 Tax=Ilumatobacter sp. TaxID=1967498 RepID=UPI003C33D5E0